jgi:hypothetical protein
MPLKASAGHPWATSSHSLLTSKELKAKPIKIPKNWLPRLVFHGNKRLSVDKQADSSRFFSLSNCTSWFLFFLVIQPSMAIAALKRNDKTRRRAKKQSRCRSTFLLNPIEFISHFIW